MPSQDRTDEEQRQRFDAERRLQVGAALLLGVIVLVAIILRAGVRNVFPPDWWRSW